ncbi:hypothetical protein FKW77_007614 [Venturia effusa]|uniref:BHLH domain-containing protein n=1 Tax=Venturia effusa TaxID=50376 RepID=A0A517LKS2_9PEZI|nr:hypothetical protein FKW77_007614 [Venturia effusa]
MAARKSGETPLALEGVAIGPYCVVDGQKLSPLNRAGSAKSPLNSKSQPSLQDPTVNTTAEHNNISDKKMDGLDYNFIDDMAPAWTGARTEGGSYEATASPRTLSNAMLPSNHSWTDYTSWNPNRPRIKSNQSPAGSMSTEEQRSLFGRRANSLINHPALGLSSAGQQTPVSAASNIPFTFGTPGGSTPAFDFGGASSHSSATVSLHDGSSWSATLNPLDTTGAAMQSPLGFSGLSRLNNIVVPSLPAVPSAVDPVRSPQQHTPTSANCKTNSSVSSPSSPEEGASVTTNTRKRKSEASDDAGVNARKQQPIKKTAHNMIEKRYRTNLNDKIAALRDSVPSLRVMSRPGSNGNEEEDDPEDLEGLTPAHKLNKATVLAKATEYIRHLEKRNKNLAEELAAVKDRLDSYEKMSMAPMGMGDGLCAPDLMTRYQHEPFSSAPTTGGPSGPIQGMIPVPADIENIRRNGLSGTPYGQWQTTYASNPPRTQPGQSNIVSGRGGSLGKVLVGSLGGLMLFEAFTENEQTGNEPAARGLFAAPISLVSQVIRLLYPQSLMFGIPPQQALSVFRLALLCGAFIYVVAPLLNLKPRPKKEVLTLELSCAPSLASPVEVRQKAWLTAIQTVWVPRHNFFLEASALLLKTLKLSTRKLIGWDGFALLFKVTKEQEAARVKAWEIALDAQLTGGDAEISMSRLILTLMASGTLPNTPARLMLKALHIRVLFWEVGRAGWGGVWILNEFSMWLARNYWSAARTEHRARLNSNSRSDSTGDDQPLPSHLAALLDLDAGDVLLHSIVQRAYNLAWNRPSSEDTDKDASTDSVVEDFAISSPLDALAAWLSSHYVNTVLAQSLAGSAQDVIIAQVDTAIAIAPPTSGAQIRALTAKAVIVKQKRLDLVDAAYQALPSESIKKLESPKTTHTLLNVIGRGPIPPDIRSALLLAKYLALAEAKGTEGTPSEAHQSALHRSIAAINRYRPSENSLTLLTFVAAFGVLDTFTQDSMLLESTRSSLELMVTCMRVWVGKNSGNVTSLPTKLRTKCVERCISTSKMLVGVDFSDTDSDAGYVSQDKGEEIEMKLVSETEKCVAV